MGEIGKFFLLLGIVLAGVGVFLIVLGKIPGIGRLPGDIYVKKDNFTFYFPLATCILISLILSLIFQLWQKR